MLDDLKKERELKRDALKKAGLNVYPAKVLRTHTIEEALKDFSELEKSQKEVVLAGRVMGKRGHGGVFFLDLRDENGSFQIVAGKDHLKDFDLFQNNLDIGDFVGVTGKLFVTQRGEKSIQAVKLEMLVKSLLPIPGEWYGLQDPETKLRKRYLELLLNADLREMFVKKSKFWNEFRTILLKNKFLEVETPVLENIPGGADAEPFKTTLKALDISLYLRISLEIAQKKLLVGGFEKIFELGRIFRNEGIDNEHLQDYTQLEFYWAYQNYGGLMKFVEKLYKNVIKKTLGNLKTNYQGQEIDWSLKWPKLEYFKLFKEHVGLNLDKVSTEELLAEAEKRGLKPDPNLGKGRLMDLLFKKLVRPHLVQPAFLVNPPVEIEPLAKRSAKHPNRVERFQVVACGTELGKGFSEGNDPADQRARFMEQMSLREKGDKEAQQLDEDFLEALEYGMPPAAGFGVSERLFSVLVDKPVRETVFFPLMRPKS